MKFARRFLQLAFILVLTAPAFATTWFVRADGGTRYSVNVPSGQCNGKYDASYASTGGTGVNQNCAYNQFQFMWDDDSQSGGYIPGAVGWVASGGDTIVVRGCAAGGRTNPSAPNCPIGWFGPTGPSDGGWCYGAGNNACYNPTIPAGTSGAHTRILAGCAYDSTPGPCNTGNTTNLSNLTQLFGGFGLNWTINFQGTQYVDFEGFEVTEHNGVCVRHGSPAYPRNCSTSPPVDDFADTGLLFSNTTANITLQDLSIHGFTSGGMQGPVGPGTYTMLRVGDNFNAFVGWTLDDGGDTPNASGATIYASYVTMMGNGCFEEYPVVHSWPALSCYSVSQNGFGDSWSGQDGPLASFTCLHCVNNYNVKDAFIGPHTQIANLDVEYSTALGNMGAAMKFAVAPNATVLFRNDTFGGNCARQQAAIPGAVQNFDITTGLNGSYLSDYCRGNAAIAFLGQPGANIQFVGNTIMSTFSIIFQQNCGYYTNVPSPNTFVPLTTCNTATNFVDNVFLGYTDPAVGTSPPELYYRANCGDGTAFTASYNVQYGVGVTPSDGCGAGVPPTACGTSGVQCTDPVLLNEPGQTWVSESALDVFNPFVSGNSYYPTLSSPGNAAGTPVSGLTTDYYGTSRTNPPWIGAVNSLSSTPTAATPTFSPVGGTYSSTQTVTISTSTSGATICWNTTGAPATNGTTGCTTGTLYTGTVSVSSSETLYAVAGGTGYLDSSVGSASYVIASGVAGSSIRGTSTARGTVTYQP
jgi:hypothetical protein